MYLVVLCTRDELLSCPLTRLSAGGTLSVLGVETTEGSTVLSFGYDERVLLAFRLQVCMYVCKIVMFVFQDVAAPSRLGGPLISSGPWTLAAPTTWALRVSSY